MFVCNPRLLRRQSKEVVILRLGKFVIEAINCKHGQKGISATQGKVSCFCFVLRDELDYVN